MDIEVMYAICYASKLQLYTRVHASMQLIINKHVQYVPELFIYIPPIHFI